MFIFEDNNSIGFQSLDELKKAGCEEIFTDKISGSVSERPGLDKVEKYVKTKKLNMLYAVDPKGDSWKVFKTKTMPTNFLIEKGGRIKAIAAGCEPSGLVAEVLSKKVADLLKTQTVDVKKKVQNK